MVETTMKPLLMSAPAVDAADQAQFFVMSRLEVAQPRRHVACDADLHGSALASLDQIDGHGQAVPRLAAPAMSSSFSPSRRSDFMDGSCLPCFHFCQSVR